MSPADARRLQLLAELRRDWSQVEHHLGQAQSVEPEDTDANAALVALSLDHAYQAFETMLLRLERGLGLQDRTGANWHITLLADAGLSIENLRPAVYPPEAKQDWHALLRFRHFLRHAYATPLDAEELRRNRASLAAAVAATGTNVEALLSALK
jgi:hypothetical protein